jgi:hypothetical protein
MCRWNDKMIYSPVCVFIDMWKHMNKVMIKEDIKSIDIDVNTGSISIRAVYE